MHYGYVLCSLEKKASNSGSFSARGNPVVFIFNIKLRVNFYQDLKSS